jgi:hypothetical protein
VKPEDLPALLRAIAGYDEIGDKQTRLALQLLAMTFVRTNELRVFTESSGYIDG